jgi:4-diphosphocytidyl-2-C-methyl-D-erythritol kinase
MARLLAHAKLTLSLRVTGVRGDGYHLIDAEMVSLGLADGIDIEEADETTLEIDGPCLPTGRTWWRGHCASRDAPPA